MQAGCCMLRQQRQDQHGVLASLVPQDDAELEVQTTDGLGCSAAQKPSLNSSQATHKAANLHGRQACLCRDAQGCWAPEQSCPPSLGFIICRMGI